MVTAPVSVVIPCFQCSATIARALESVLLQTLPPCEIIIVDDFSDDGPLISRLVESYRSSVKFPVRIVIERLTQNRGPGHARNIGWELASQEFVAFLDADDSWQPQKLAMQVEFMRRYPGYSLTCHQTVLFNKSNRFSGLGISVKHTELSKYKMLLQNSVATRTVMIRRAIPYRFATTFMRSEDYYLWLTLVFANEKAAKILSPLAVHYKPDFGAGGLSGDVTRMHMGVKDCLKQLYCEKKISYLIFHVAVFIEQAKFLRRLMWLFFKAR